MDKIVSLAKITKASIEQEAKQVYEQKEYAIACASWVCVKSYYLQYYLETIMLYLINLNDFNLNAKHTANRNQIRNLINDKKLVFSNNYFVPVMSCLECEYTGLKSGDSIRAIADGDRYKQVMKKIREYSLDDFKIHNKIKRLSGANKVLFNNKKLNLVDYFYWYRIKSNYRDLNFITDENAKTNAVYEFYNNYSSTVINLSNAYIILINELYRKRTGKDQGVLI